MLLTGAGVDTQVVAATVLGERNVRVEKHLRDGAGRLFARIVGPVGTEIVRVVERFPTELMLGNNFVE
ncbi:hypothetical protein O4215_25000 [Rhodococcus maanshanensis]|nr:hypothetical protein [Rhodococcus maanshanensis]MCZ4558826.1 hypothetical protein [Rhodococcus maanshanensis]